MRKMGFTLAEVLITMTIIGVVAALTTPALLHNVATADIGPKLAKFRETVENANRLMLVENDVNRLSVLIRRAGTNTGDRTDRYTELLQNFMRLDSGASPIANIREYNGDTTNTANVTLFNPNTDAANANNDVLKANQLQVSLANGFTFRTVEGMAAHFFLAPQVQAAAGGVPIEPDNLGVILVDINGNANPNSLGKDIFGFILGNNGMLTPIGSRAVNNAPMQDDDGNNIDIADDASSWTTTCPDANGNITGQGLTCTGSIFANDLKVVYQD